MDLWASIVAKIPYTYAIEIGPLDTELTLIQPKKGFHVEEKYIKYVAVRAFYGIHQYLKSFIDKITKAAQAEIKSTCNQEYDTFYRYHSK